MYGSFLAWDWMADGRFPTRHESAQRAIAEIEERWGDPDYCDELLENDAPSKLGDDEFRRWYATRLRLSASPRAAADLQRMNTDTRGVVSSIGEWPGGIGAITLFVEDLHAARRFYGEVFGLPVFHEDASSAVFEFGDTLVNLLKAAEAPELVAPAAVATREAGVRFQFTLGVDDGDAMCEVLRQRGVELLNGPIDRPWGIRTASFRDPGGHIWEIAR
jgi:catechol 2,3-dioxygenase-like lactoylglutathione lyase family enzyme